MKQVNAIIVENKKLFVVKRVKEPWPDMYAFPGGHVEENESNEHALLREVMEETGFKIDIIKFCGTIKFLYNGKFFEVFYYNARITGGKERINPNEVSEIKWLTYKQFFDNLKNFNLHPAGILMLNKFVRKVSSS